MTKPPRFDSVVAEAPPTTVKPTAVTARKPAQLELGDDELIQFIIKPSLWFIPLAAGRWLVCVAVLAGALWAAMYAGWTPTAVMPFQVLAVLTAMSLGVATLQWATRLYVLTNRRVMRFKGILRVEVMECPLARIEHVALDIAPYQRLAGLGTVHMQPGNPPGPALSWEQLAHPTEIHDRLLRAIHQAKHR